MAFDGTYYKIYEFTEVIFQIDDGDGTFTPYSFAWPNKLTPNQETQNYTWQGGGQRKIINSLIAMGWTVDLDAMDLANHAAVFGAPEITAQTNMATILDLSTLVPVGTLADAQGVSVGMLAKGNALAGDTETTVGFALWAPVCTLTLTALPGLTSGNIADKPQYSISATRTAVDIAGIAITGAPATGAFAYIGALA